MPLDCSLFHDLNTSVNYHVMIAKQLLENDLRKFSISTVIRGVKAYLRVLAPPDDLTIGSPTSRHIIDDVNNWIVHLQAIYDVNGITIFGIDHRNGRRKTGLEVNNRSGGKRVRGKGKSKLKTIKDAWLHEDAIHSKKKHLLSLGATVPFLRTPE